MDIVLDKFGKPIEVLSYYCHADMWVVSLLPQNTPMACVAINVDSKERFEWEENPKLELLDRIHSVIEGKSTADEWGISKKKYRLFRYYADFLPLIKFPEKQVVSCIAIKSDGELVCQWVRPDFRGSVTKYAYSYCFLVHVLEMVFVPNGITKIWGWVHKDNEVSNKYHISQGSTLAESKVVDGNIFNKYEQDISVIISKAKRLSGIQFQREDRLSS